MLQEPQTYAPVYHHFAPGLYIREVIFPAGIFAIGHTQTTTHLNVFLKGRVTIVGDGEVKELVAPMIFTSPPGKKAGFVHEEMVWMNVYATDETDVQTLEEMFLDKHQNKNWEEYAPHEDRSEDQEDYLLVLKEYGLTQEDVEKDMELGGDPVPFPYGSYCVAVYPSDIHGRGLFATADIQAGTAICKVVVNGQKTPAGRYTNHAKTPNAEIVEDTLYATRDISGCFGGGNGEEITIDYRNGDWLCPQQS